MKKTAKFLCIILLLGFEAIASAQQTQLLSNGAWVLTSADLDSIRTTVDGVRLRTVFTDTISNVQLQRTTATMGYAMPDRVKIVESGLVLTFMHNGKLEASHAVAYDSMFLSALVTYRKIGAATDIVERVVMHITQHSGAGEKTFAKDTWLMPDVLWARISIDTFRCYPATLSSTQLSNDLSIFRAEILGEQYVQMPTGATAPSAPTGLSVKVSENGGFAQVWWNPLEWASGYDLEWTFIDNYGTTAPTLNYNFRNNSTRVQIENTQYEMPLVSGEGIYVFRVRANGRRSNGNTASGPWTKAESGSVPSHNATRIAGDRLYLQGNLVHESGKKNWQYQASFAENGMRRDVVQYFDGALKSRQVVSQLSTDGKHLIIGEQFYDHHGRSIVQALPVPFKPNPDTERRTEEPTYTLIPNIYIPAKVLYSPKPAPLTKTKKKRRNDPFATIEDKPASAAASSGSTGRSGLHSWILPYLEDFRLGNIGSAIGWDNVSRYFDQRPAIRFQPRFTVNAAGEAYSSRDFPSDSLSAAPFGTYSGAGNYYSPACPVGVPYRHLIPDAEGYPFIQTSYTPDLTGRVARQSAPGLEYKMGSGHEIKMAYTTPTQHELDRLFGNDVGDARLYKKQVTTDPNGQMVVQYINPDGAVIATAAAGTSPGNTMAVESETVAQTADLVAENTRLEASGMQKIATRSVTITQDRSLLTLHYQLEPKQVSALVCPSVTVCDQAVYDLRIVVYNQNGKRLFNHTKRIGNLNNTLDCVSGVPYAKDTSFLLDRGTYLIEKTLIVNKLNQDRFVEAALTAAKPCIETAVKRTIDPVPCSPDACEPCQFEKRGTLLIRRPHNQPDCQRSCQFDETTGVFNRQAYEAMLRDMLPGGQYAELYTDMGDAGRAIDVRRFPLSVFNTTSTGSLGRYDASATTLFNYRRPAYPYLNADGSKAEIDMTAYRDDPAYYILDSAIVRGSQVFVTPGNVNNLEFLSNIWEETWSESLVAYHPEYSYYLYQLATMASLRFDTLMQRSNYADAIRAGWISPDGGLVTAAQLQLDPAFASSGATGIRNEMLAALNSTSARTSPAMHIHQLLRLAAHCNSPYYAAAPAELEACIGSGASADLSADAQTFIWESYRAIYQSKKAALLDRRIPAAPINACIAADTYRCPTCSDPDLANLFRNKSRIFQRADCFERGVTPRLSDIDGDGISELYERIGLDHANEWSASYMSAFCGVDTIAHDWLQFFSALALKKQFVSVGTTIPGVPPVVLNKSMIARFPNRSVPNYRWTANVTGASVAIRISDPAGVEQARFTLTASTTIQWDKIYFFSCIRCTGGRYEMVAYTEDLIPYTLTISGISNLNLSSSCQNNLDAQTRYRLFGKETFECCMPIMPKAPGAPNCQTGQLVQERMNEAYEIDRRLAVLRDSMSRHYQRIAMSGAEQCVLNWSEPLYSYTLFYYDLNGDLIKTVPPKAVKTIANTGLVNQYRISSAGRTPVFPVHNDGIRDTLSTEFRYNSLNNKIYRATPDGGVTRNYFDEAGRIILSQDAEQRIANKSTYTLFDVQGRSIESGVLTPVGSDLLSETINGSGIIPYQRLADRIAATPRATSEVYRTSYDKAPAGALAAKSKFAGGAQKRLRGRVSRQSFYTRGDQTQYDYATHMSYDIAGNVTEFVQDFAALATNVRSAAAHSLKHMRYRYDLLTGYVTESAYQAGQPDQFYHWFQYDAEGRMQAVQTGQHRFESSDVREREVRYFYYLHGPVARAEIGNDFLQGLDFAYTLDGKLKNMNSVSQAIEADMMRDGRGIFATDALAFSLQYYPGDYKPIGRTDRSTSHVSAFGVEGPAQFNGNISGIITRNEGLDYGTERTLATVYKYDQLGRLRQSKSFRSTATALGALSANTANGLFDATRDLGWTNLGNQWATTVNYDKNGNITALTRYGNTGILIDQMAYAYEAGSNKLLNIRDASGKTLSGDAVVDMPGDNRYTYDAKGRLTQERSSGIADLIWSATDKLLSYSQDGRATTFGYDAFGRRALKREANGTTTITVRDLKGNILSNYTATSAGVRWSEVPIYAANRLATWQPDTLLGTPIATVGGARRYGFFRGQKAYELTQHTGEVLAVISDRKLQVSVGSDVSWSVDFRMAQEYYPFGMPMPGRVRTSGKAYPFGFQGMVSDNNLRGNGNSYSTEFRQYDPRVGRWLSLDPMLEKYAGMSPYTAFANNPVMVTDSRGDDVTMEMPEFVEAYRQTREEVMREQHGSEDVARITLNRMHQRYGRIRIHFESLEAIGGGEDANETLEDFEEILDDLSETTGLLTDALEIIDNSGNSASINRQAVAIGRRLTEQALRLQSSVVAESLIRRFSSVGTGNAGVRRLQEAVDGTVAHTSIEGLGRVDRYLLVLSILNDVAEGDLRGLLATGTDEALTAALEALSKRFGIGAIGRVAGGAAVEVIGNFIFPDRVGDSAACSGAPAAFYATANQGGCEQFVELRNELVRQLEVQRREAIQAATVSPQAARRMTMSGGN